MFKAQTLRRSFSLFRRAPTRAVLVSTERDGHDVIRAQSVRIKKPFFTRSRLLNITVTTACLWAIREYLINGIELEEIDVDEDDDEEETGLIFFPTGLSRPKKREFYKGSDPEWQEFVRIAPDRKRIERIRGELVSMVRNLTMRNPTYTRRLGKIDPKAGAIWIEVQFPDAPGVEYERPGYELTDELNLRKTNRPVEVAHHRRLTSALYPTNAATSLYMDTKRRAIASWQEFKKYVGWKEATSPPTSQNIVKSLGAPPSNSQSSPPTTASTTSTSPPTSSAADGAQTKDSSLTERFGASLPDPTVLPTLDLGFFRTMFRKNLKPVDMPIPRGAFKVSGLIEVMGERAKSTLDVTAYYDPKFGKYVYLSVKVKSITDYTQSPKGGP